MLHSQRGLGSEVGRTVTGKLYDGLAAWWPLLSPPDDYLDEAGFFHRTLSAASLPPEPTLLELGSGGGNNALHLKAHFARVTLTDLSPRMLEVSRALNPDCEHIVGDMRTLRLGRAFDVVFIHDAIDYMTTRQDLRLALETAAVHCAPGGLALVVPDHVRETFRPDTEHGGSDGGDGRALRYLEWDLRPGRRRHHLHCRVRVPAARGRRTGARRVRDAHLRALLARRVGGAVPRGRLPAGDLTGRVRARRVPRAPDGRPGCARRRR